MIELGDRVETMQGQEGIVAASPRNGQGWLIQLDGGKTVRRWDEELWLCLDDAPPMRLISGE